ncbi:MAG: 50S ribosomal protein L31 [Rickettsiales bacterium]|jgi:large subunit ribosomal protein L31|nr:50S ribosomal protein L31 [Rickettsiales bacterium]
MKKDIHPDYHDITVLMTNGTKFKTKSTWGKLGDTMTLDIDPSTHPAWVGGVAFLNENVSKVAEFKKKFGAFSFTGAASNKAVDSSDTQN